MEVAIETVKDVRCMTWW